MRIRSALFLALVAAGMSACANFTGPMECDGNPKCKADLQPSVAAPILASAPAPSLVGRQGRVK